MTATAPTITETRYAKLKAKLRELFELDKADLDFGIYRIMAAKNTEVTDFLDRQLKDRVRETLAAHGSGELDKIKAELNETVANLRENAVPAEQIETNAKVVGLRGRLEAAGGKTGEELEADIYNHLLAFFSRYYDEGDFISQRRYKGDTYAIPYSGEEVTLHWANKDQYYIKSGEWHKDYRFKLPTGKRVRFALVDATQETNNNKEADESKRRYILVEDNPVSIEGDTLTLRFHFRAPSEAEKKRADGEDAEQPPVAIFGGKYEKTTKGDERERFCADAEQRAIPHIPADWARVALAESPTDAKPKRTLLGKHLDAFTARNTFDYFIHKDLGGFLSRELDFYIKNEVVRLDDLDKAPADHLQRIQGRVKAIRTVASSIIELLASIENFQKKLWLKKKFVLNTSWLVTVDRVPERLRDTVAENAEQWAEWERLGFKPEGDAGGLFGGAEWGTRAYLDACDKLVVDTRLFDEAFTAEVLASDEILRGTSAIDDSICARLVNGDNAAAMRLTEPAVANSVRCVYIDPPYNTEGDRASGKFLYKDGYAYSSWASLLNQTLRALTPLMNSHCMLFMSIDDTEQATASMLLDHLLGSSGTKPNFLGTMPCVNNLKGNNDEYGFAGTHEYLLAGVISRNSTTPGMLALDEESLDEWEEDEIGPFKQGANLKSTGANAPRSKRPNLWFPVFIDDDGAAYVTETDEPRSDTHETLWPITGNEEMSWRWSKNKFSNSVSDVIVRGEQGSRTVYKKQRPSLGDLPSAKPKSVLYDPAYSSGNGTEQQKALFGRKVFPNPKPLKYISDIVEIGLGGSSGVVLDPFAGSGTTGHAVLVKNRSLDNPNRLLLLEMGEYFYSVLRPRIAKVLYSPDWQNGKPQSHNNGLSALVKCFAVESYEDALNNLPAPAGGIFDGRPAEEADALIRYALDLEMGPHLLDLDIFRDPWGHAINAQLAGDDEIKRHRVDLVETFNYLLGLRVSAYGPIERYSAEFERAEHDDGLGRLKLTGRLRRDPDGPFKFQRVEGILNDESNTRVLVVWRTLTDDPEQDAAVLDAWMARHREATTERTEHRDYHQIYINGPVTLPQPTAEIRTVWPIEEAFKRKMFEDTDGVS